MKIDSESRISERNAEIDRGKAEVILDGSLYLIDETGRIVM